MPLNWYKNIISKAKNFQSKIGELEDSVLDERDKFKDIFEKNIALEKEITERTDELNQANKSLLTLKHIWSTMNSSEPLSEVLSTVVNGLSDELGYLYCAIFQIFEERGESILRIRAANTSNLDDRVHNILKQAIDVHEIPVNNRENALVQAIQEKNIKIVRSFKNIFQGSNPEFDKEQLNQLDSLFGNRSITVLPIVVQEKFFGCLIVVSIRNDLSDTERNFLNLFVGQIELAVTIAGLFEQIREQAITDGLTGLYNRRHFDQCLISETERS